MSAAAEMIPVPAVQPVVRVRAVRDGRSPVRLRSRARDRRLGPPAARGAWLHRGAGRLGGRASIDDPLASIAGDLEPLAQRFFDGLRAGQLRRQPRSRAPRCSSRRCCATPSGVAPLDAYQIEFGKVGTPSTVVEDLTDGAHQGHRGARRARSTRSSIRPRPSPSASRAPTRRCSGCALVQRGARGGRAPRQPHVPRVAHAGGARRRGRVRWSAGPATASRATRAVPRRSTSSTAAASRATSRRARPSIRSSAVPSTGSAVEREVTVVAVGYDQRMLIHVPEVKGNQTTGITLLHVRFHDRLAGRRGRVACSRATAIVTSAIADQVTEIEPVMRDDVLGTHRPRRAAHRAGRALAEHWK